jgi:hypothetical protein
VLCGLFAQDALGQIAIRPVSVFVNAQGTYSGPSTASGACIVDDGVVPPYVGWCDPNSKLGMAADYAGLANTFLTGANPSKPQGTRFFGVVIERRISTSPVRSEVLVTLTTLKALTYVIDTSTGSGPDADFANDGVVFGSRPIDVCPPVNAPAALGTSYLQVKFHDDGFADSLPDLADLLANRPSDVKSLLFSPPPVTGLVHAPLFVEGTRGVAAAFHLGRQTSSGFAFQHQKTQVIGRRP